MRREVPKVIDGESYTFYQFGATEAGEQLTNLLDIFGPALGNLMSAVGDDIDGKKKKLADKQVDTNKLGVAIASLCTRMHEKRVILTIKAFMAQVIHTKSNEGDGKGMGDVSKVFDEHFQGRIGHMIKVFLAAVEVQYSDFFGVFGGSENLLRRVQSKLGPQI